MIFKIPNNILLKKVFVVFIYDTNILLSAIPGRTIPLSNIISPALVIGILAQSNAPVLTAKICPDQVKSEPYPSSIHTNLFLVAWY